MPGLAYAMFGCENNEKRRISFHLRVIFCYGSSFEQGGLDHAGDGRDYFFGRLLGQAGLPDKYRDDISLVAICGECKTDIVACDDFSFLVCITASRFMAQLMSLVFEWLD